MTHHTIPRLVDVGDTAAGVYAGAAATPGDKQADDVDEEPEADALIAVDPEEDEQARDEQGYDRGDDADDRGDVMRHAVLKPREHDADAREKEGEDEKPERDSMSGKIEMGIHGWLLLWGESCMEMILTVGCYLVAKVKLALAIDFGGTVIWMSCSPRVSWTAARV